MEFLRGRKVVKIFVNNTLRLNISERFNFYYTLRQLLSIKKESGVLMILIHEKVKLGVKKMVEACLFVC